MICYAGDLTSYLVTPFEDGSVVDGQDDVADGRRLVCFPHQQHASKHRGANRSSSIKDIDGCEAEAGGAFLTGFNRW